MLNSFIKRAVLDGQNTVRDMIFNYKNKNFLKDVWDCINESLGDEYLPISTPKITSTNVLFFKGQNLLDRTFIICKIPLDKAAQVRTEQSFGNITSLHSYENLSRKLIPFPVKQIQSSFGNIYIETMFVGTDGFEAVRKNNMSATHAINIGINEIKDIQAMFPQSSSVVSEEMIDKFTQDLNGSFSRNGIDDFRSKQLMSLLKKVENKEITFGFSHGDYWLGNILFSQNRLIGIIDWERLSLNRPVMYDPMHLELFYHAINNGWSLGEEVISRYKQNPCEDLIIYWCYFLNDSINSNPLITKNKRWLEKNYFRVIQNLG
jgi:thiamine kinase-like enzyme